jgi:2-hydroxychromene-2-carboxylate isomerase
MPDQDPADPSPAAPSIELFFDVGSPYAWLAAERVESLLGPVAWRPVLLGGIFAAVGRASWAQTDARGAGIAEIERRAADRGLPPVAWPERWPNDGLRAMRAAAWADRISTPEHDAVRAFALAALRTHFVDGLPLDDEAHLRAALTAAGLDADEGLAATDDPSVQAHLRTATEDAVARGVIGVPTLAFDDRLVWGDDGLDAFAR